jgi:N-acetylneuraminate synthase
MTFLIAEIGINHNGDMSVTKKLIDEAKIAGFDAVKFQKRNIDKVYSKKILDSVRDSPWGTTQREQKEGLEFDQSQYEEIDNYCKAKNIIWFASAWETDSLDFLDQFDLKYNKIASAMIVDSNFLNQVALKKKHTFISTGMSTLENIENAVNIFKKNDCSFELMHCVSTYPCKPEDVNLKAINSLKEKFNCKVGYSGHENGVVISLAAYTLGISSLERHITLDRTMYGSDQSASLEIKGMRELINGIKKIDYSLGDGKLGLILDEEKKIAEKLRSHIS